MQSRAVAKYVRVSPRKADAVLALIRGLEVSRAQELLAFTTRPIAVQIGKVLKSAVANATQKDGFGGDVERLFVNACYANQGPSQTRIRPAPMGRAFRVVKRTAHLTVEVTEKPSKITAPEGGARKRARGAAPKRPQAATAGRKTASTSQAKKTTAKKSRAAAATE